MQDEHTGQGAGGGRPPAREVPDPLLGKKLGPYRIESLIGAGGMGLVYLGVDEALQRRAAIKVLSLLSPRWVARFIAEARHQARLDHPNIVSVHGAGMARVGGLEVHYIALKYIEGSSLAEVVREQGPLEPLQATELILDAARGLYYVHSEGFVHRDVKPSNILIDLGERALISDFGVSLNETGEAGTGTGSEFLGTWSYASPEQLARRPVDARSDIYSLGATYQFALTGVEAVDERAAGERSGVRRLPIDPALPPLVRFTIEQMLRPDPDQRFGSMLECIESLERAQRSLTGARSPMHSALGGSSGGGPSGRSTARRWLMAVLLLLLLGAVPLAYLLDELVREDQADGSQATALVSPDSGAEVPGTVRGDSPSDPPDAGATSEPAGGPSELAQRVIELELELLPEMEGILEQSGKEFDPATLFRRIGRLLKGRVDQLEQRALEANDTEALELFDQLADQIAPRLAPVLNGLEVETRDPAGNPFYFDVHPITNLQYFAFLQRVFLEDSGSFLAPLRVQRELMKDVWIDYQDGRPIGRPRFGQMLASLVAPSTLAVERFAQSVSKRLPTRDEWMEVIGPALLVGKALYDRDFYDRVTWIDEYWFAGVPDRRPVCWRRTTVDWRHRCARLVRGF